MNQARKDISVQVCKIMILLLNDLALLMQLVNYAKDSQQFKF